MEIRERIGILGGTFNPIHNAHMHIADVAANEYKLDKVLFVPAGNPYTKNKEDLISAKHRLAMTEIACLNDKRFCVSDVDCMRTGPTYGIDTVTDIKKIYPNAALFYIVGTDTYNQLPTWKDYDKLIKLTNFLVVLRSGENPRWRHGIENNKIDFIVNQYESDISSTKIRKCLKDRMSCKYMMPNGVYEYIVQNGLYRENTIRIRFVTNESHRNVCISKNTTLLQFMIDMKAQFILNDTKIWINGTVIPHELIGKTMAEFDVTEESIIAIVTKF